MMDDGHRPVRDRVDGRLDQASGGSGAQQLVDVVDAEREDKAVDRAGYEERDYRFTRRQRRGHGLGGAQHTVDDPRLPPDLGGEPSGEDRDPRQWKAEEDRPQHPALLADAFPDAEIRAIPGEEQHQEAAADHDPEREEWDRHRRPI